VFSSKLVKSQMSRWGYLLAFAPFLAVAMAMMAHTMRRVMRVNAMLLNVDLLLQMLGLMPNFSFWRRHSTEVFKNTFCFSTTQVCRKTPDKFPADGERRYGF
jgi:hypothetical protein